MTEDFVTNKSMQSILAASADVDLKFLLAVINSRLLSWYFLQTSSIAQRDDFPKIVLKETRNLPVPRINPSEESGPEVGAQLVARVDLLLALQRELATAQIAGDQETLRRQIAATDAEIDRLIYGLFNLSSEEIATIERGVGIEGPPAAL